ncbi:MAG: SHOCT domain-containing protein [Proteobacteria bacterium]|nr:SHOCT domain-containing protein [Pseudomonadota bacterium]MBU4298319.1 SHOCT domain-containing protein [Pseudomonadota bacterium]
MYGYGSCYWGPGNWFGGGPFMVLLAILLILLLVSLLRSSGSKSARQENALDILKRRYAAGEINKEQFQTMKRDLLD